MRPKLARSVRRDSRAHPQGRYRADLRTCCRLSTGPTQLRALSRHATISSTIRIRCSRWRSNGWSRAWRRAQRQTLVHGDFRHGNLLISPNGVEAALDWELTHIGDPLEDIGWVCTNSWRFGVQDKVVGGFGDLPDLLAGYEDAGGGRIDPEEVRTWIVYGSLKWGIMCMRMYQGFLRDRSVERAAIGRRSSETEIDLINLIIGGKTMMDQPRCANWSRRCATSSNRRRCRS